VAMSRSRTFAARAVIYADAATADEAAPHQNIADDLTDLIESSFLNWLAMAGTSWGSEPDMDSLFGSSSHLQAIYAARELPQ
jgi:hypothetical protein